MIISRKKFEHEKKHGRTELSCCSTGMSEPELKPCPFCGGEAKFVQTAHGSITAESVHRNYAIQCVKCKARPYDSFTIRVWLAENGVVMSESNKNEAIEAWNRRANDE